VSTETKSCPHCGASTPGTKSVVGTKGALVIGGLCVLTMGMCMVGAARDSSSPSASTTPTYDIGQRVTLTKSAFECHNRDNLERLIDIAKDDRVAAVRFLADPLNGCRMAPAQSDAIVEDYSPFHAAVKVHEQGDPTEWWVNTGHVLGG